VDVAEPLENIYEDIENTNTPPEPKVPRRAASYSDFYHVARAHIHRREHGGAKRKKSQRKDRDWEALMLPDEACQRRYREIDSEKVLGAALDERLLDANQEDYSLYRDQLQLTERHLDGLIGDANSTLQLLTTLSNAFQSVENQTSSFQSQCEDLLNEQRRLEKLANEVGTDLHYYAYLETATRRLNGPGASRLVDDESFGEMVENIEACIVFMNEHVSFSDLAPAKM
jgi:conserved oligomeric Golgi complex subunit 3